MSILRGENRRGSCGDGVRVSAARQWHARALRHDFTKVQVGRLAPCASEALAAAAAVAESGEIELAAAGLVDGCHWFVLLVGDNKSVHC